MSRNFSRKVTMGGPKRRGGYRSYDEHDNRNYNNHYQGGPARRGSFKRSAPKKQGYYNPRHSDPGPRVHLLPDYDEDMSGDSAQPRNQRVSPYGSRDRGRGRGGRYRGHMNVDENKMRKMGVPIGRGTDVSTWSKVTIPHGKKISKEFLLKSLAEQSRVPFVPYHYHVEGNNTVFFVNDQVAGTAIRELSRTISDPTGRKVVLFVNGCPPPSMPLTKEVIEKLKLGMSRRYNNTNKMLDLSDLTQDQEFKQEGLFFALNRFNVASAVLDIIQEHIPDLETLDLSSNKLYALDGYRLLHTKAPNLVRLNIGKNQLKAMNELDNIKQLKLTELQLDGNPFCTRYDKTAYVSDIRKRFPKLALLDGSELPVAIGFDIESSSVLPRTQKSFFLNDAVKNLVCRFLDQYYALYDSANRQPLMEAYHEQCSFSLTAFNNRLNLTKQGSLSDYFMVAHNLLRIQDQNRRQKLLKCGRLNVVSLLCELPASHHDPASYVVDVNHSGESLLCFTVHGLFKECDSKSSPQPIRSFSRTFIAVPCGEGIAIINEEFVLTQASPAQIKGSFESPAPTPSPSPVAGASQLAPDVQQQMVKHFSKQSTMNLEWSLKCLEQNEWDYDKAAKAFEELQAKGAIPPNAFVMT